MVEVRQARRFLRCLKDLRDLTRQGEGSGQEQAHPIGGKPSDVKPVGANGLLALI